MQAYCVSKRPPRALYLGLAIALGMVAVSTVVLSQMGGGLLRDGTYLRLLGLLALESRRLPDRARRDGCERLSRRPLRLERPRSDAGTAPRGRRPEPLGRSRERDAEPRTQLGPEPGSRPCGRPRPAGGQRDRPRPGEWLS